MDNITKCLKPISTHIPLTLAIVITKQSWTNSTKLIKNPMNQIPRISGTASGNWMFSLEIWL